MKYIKVYEIGNPNTIKCYPLETYLDIVAIQAGYEDYKDLKKAGLKITINQEDIIEEKEII